MLSEIIKLFREITMKKIKIIHNIFKYFYVIAATVLTVPFILFLAGAFLSYFFSIDIIVNYHRGFGIDYDTIPTIKLIYLLQEWIFLISIFLSVFFVNKK
jgi:hypothetical protein